MDDTAKKNLEGRQALVLALVQQLKTGQITKEQLFSMLNSSGSSTQTSLGPQRSDHKTSSEASRDVGSLSLSAQQSPSTTPRASRADGQSFLSTPRSSDKLPFDTKPSSGFHHQAQLKMPTDEERRAVLQQVLDEKRRSLSGYGASVGSPRSDSQSALNSDPSPLRRTAPARINPAIADQNISPQNQDSKEQTSNLSISQGSQDLDSTALSRSPDTRRRRPLQPRSHSSSELRRGENQGKPRSAGSSPAPASPGYAESFTSRSASELRLTGGAAAARRRRQETADESSRFSECTFRPKTTPLPNYVRRDYLEVPFVKRVMTWQDQKSLMFENMMQERSKTELDGCTFRPSISDSARRMRRKSTAPERLYQYAQDVLTKRSALQQRRDDEEIQKFCPFKPRINRRSRSNPRAVGPRYRSSPTRAESPRSESSGPSRRNVSMDSELTFAPRTNRITRSMTAAHIYLSQNAFHRLSAPRHPSPPASAAHSPAPSSRHTGGIEAASRSSPAPRTPTYSHHPGGSIPSSSPRPGAPTTPTSARRPNSTPPSPHINPSSLQKFDRFLKRQALIEQKRRQALAQRQAAAAKELLPGKPSILKKSSDMVKTSFMERISKRQAANDRRQQELRKQAEAECPFQPSINAVSKSARSRSPQERSTGDYKRILAKHAQIKKELEKREMEDVTFSPRLNSDSHGVESKLRVTSSPHNYLRRVQDEHERLERRKEQIIQERAKQELSRCTFKPEVHDAPPYVKRIARSMHSLRALQADDSPPPAPSRPAWS